MFVKLGHVYLNIDKIESIFKYSEFKDDKLDMGMCINDVKYCLFSYSMNKPDLEEKRKRYDSIIEAYLKEILNKTGKEIVNLDIEVKDDK